MKRYSAFPETPALLEPHHHIVKCHNQNTHWGGVGVLPLCREAVVVFYSPTPADGTNLNKTLVEGVERQDWTCNAYWLLFWSFESSSHQRKLMVFRWSLSDSKSPQVSRTLLSILAGLNIVVVWMVSTRPLIIKSSFPNNNPLVTYRAHRLQLVLLSLSCSIVFQFSSKVKVFIFLFAFFQLNSMVCWDGKVLYSTGSPFCWLSLGLVVRPRLGDPFVCQNHFFKQLLYSLHQGSGRPGFNPKSSHTKDLKNGTWYLFA